MRRIIYHSKCFSKKKSVPVLDKVLKISLSVFCKRSKFRCDLSQTFADYSFTSSSSMIIARLRIDEHSWCYESSKNRGFCPQIPIFENRASFWSKTKMIFGISSSSCIQPCVIKSVFLKNVFLIFMKEKLKKMSHTVFFEQYK